MSLLLLVAGLILWIAGGGWFDGAETAGIILTAVGASLFTLQTLFLLTAGSVARRRIR